MARRLLLVAFCALIAVCWISSVDARKKLGCIARCNNGCKKRYPHSNDPLRPNRIQCYMGCRRYPKNCFSCKKNSNKCYGCLPGYFLSMETCIPCPPGCRCVEPNKCQSCLNGYIMVSGVCSACPAVCDSCDSTTGKCTCKTGYVATDSPTSPCAACSTNCGVCSRNGPGNCDTCKSGFVQVPVNGICIACAANCQACDVAGAGSCDTCNDGYKLTTSSSSSTVTCTACPANCKNCDYAGTSYCDTCMTGYGLSSDHKSCVVCAQNCLSCNVNGYNKCDGAQCGSATTGYDAANIACLGASALCASVKGGGGTCDVCYTSGSCDACAATNIRTVTGNVGSCETATNGCPMTAGALNCAYCTGSSSCVKCVDAKTDTTCGTPASVSGCTGLPTGCKHCASSACADCSLGYKFNAGSCTPCAVAHCDVCETSTTICDKCADTYNLYNGGTVCKSGCDPKCATPDCTTRGQNKCDTYCVKGYAISKATATLYTCQPCSPGCSSCLIKGAGKCDDQQCAAGFSLTADFKCTK